MQLTSLTLPASWIFPQEDYKSDMSKLVSIFREQLVCIEISHNVKFPSIMEPDKLFLKELDKLINRVINHK